MLLEDARARQTQGILCPVLADAAGPADRNQLLVPRGSRGRLRRGNCSNGRQGRRGRSRGDRRQLFLHGFGRRDRIKPTKDDWRPDGDRLSRDANRNDRLAAVDDVKSAARGELLHRNPRARRLAPLYR